MSLPPLLRDQRKIDAEHLKLLAIFHYIFAGLALIGIGFLFLHWSFLNFMFTNPELQKGSNPPPAGLMQVFIWFYIVIGAVFLTAGLLNAISARCLQKRTGRTFSLVVAGLDCLCMPLGTALGVFTIIVLVRESVAELYDSAEPPPAA